MKKALSIWVISLVILLTVLTFSSQAEASGRLPVAYWKFDEGSGTTASDSSGNGNDGTIYTATWTTGRVGKALYFNGIDSWVQVPSSPTLTGLSQITLEAWIKIDSIPQKPKGIISKADGVAHPNPNAEYFLGLYAGGTLAFHVSNIDYIAHDSVPEAINETDRWYHVAATWSGNSYALYVDGIARTTGNCTPQTTNSVPIDVQIGRHGTYSWTYFDGVIDEAAIYDYARTAEEIWNDYVSGFVKPNLSLIPETGFSSTTVSGSGFSPVSKVTITWGDTEIPTVPSPLITDSYGNFTAIISVLTQNDAGSHIVKATDESGNTAGATFTVIDMTGPQGPPGQKGDTGQQGPQGEQGQQGPESPLGETRELSLLVDAFTIGASIIAICLATVALLKKKPQIQ